jgi:cell division protein FtsA
VLPLGGRQLSNAVAASLKISLNQAEQLKRRHGSAVVAAVPADSSELANSTGRFPNRIEVHQMRGIMVAQLTDIFSVIAQQLKRLGLENSLSAGVFLCGGTARTPGIIALAERELQMNTNTYCASVIDHQRTALQQPEFATAIGLVKYGVLHPRKGQD